MKRFLTVLMIMVMIPYVTTMAWTGRIGGGDFTGFEELAGAGGEGSQGGSLGTDGNGAAGRRYVAVEREGKVSRVSRRRISWSMCWRPRSRQISGRRL